VLKPYLWCHQHSIWSRREHGCQHLVLWWAQWVDLLPCLQCGVAVTACSHEAVRDHIVACSRVDGQLNVVLQQEGRQGGTVAVEVAQASNLKQQQRQSGQHNVACHWHSN
jgi:hypothetical protein